MNTVYGVEMKPPKGKLPGFTAQLVKKTTELATVIDRDKQLAIISNKQEAHALKDYYISKDVYEDFFTLLQLSKVAKPTDIFTDYGFVSQNNHYYLYNHLISGFIIKHGEEEEIKMAKLQFEEHLIAQDHGIFYIDQSYIELVEGIARAYGLELTFVVE
ncbi:hypothetical protein JI666_05825 [Bacillus sp. NTK071]|uniref:hypothetical protein n=1 Tax=Bacillus sp. NTK071 TaxID=2802175 RepID=UPI001A8D7E30|nr:hypothetical protein [Bacillus sp. NTK071]MBN8208260.1 hypothetical protein [Bacillus sp. NTK071]